MGQCLGLVATETIDLKGLDITTDSFHSGLAAHSTDGKYPFLEPWKTKAGGNVYAGHALVDTFDIGHIRIKGRLTTGPGTNTFEIGPTGSVGDKDWVEAGFNSIQPGAATTDFNIAFGNVESPSVAPLAIEPTPQVLDGTTYQYVFSTGGWYYPSAGITNNVLFNAPAGHIVRLIIYGSVNLRGQSVFRVADTGVKVRIYTVGPQFSLFGQARIDNQSGMADRFLLYGLSTCKSIFLGANASFCGGIYAPQAAFVLGGGGHDTYDFIGASVTRTVTMNGRFNFHYDENANLFSDCPPWVAAHPLNPTGTVHQPVTFSASAGGGWPVSYQWQFAGTNIAGATDSSFVIPSVSMTDAGVYTVLVTNGYGSAVSSSALTVNPQPLIHATATATQENGFVVGVTITDGGSGYTNTPRVRLVGGGGSAARAVAVVTKGVVTAINMLDAGFGYTSSPIVAIAPPFPLALNIAPATSLALADLSPGTNYQLQVLQSGNWLNLGSPFIADSSSFSQTIDVATDGSSYRLMQSPVPRRATATPVVSNGLVVAATIADGGSGYVSVPTVQFIGGGGVGAEATATVNNGAVTDITILNPGSGYTDAPVIEIAPPSVSELMPKVAAVARLDCIGLTPGINYQLQASPDLVDWTNHGLPFIAGALTNSQYLHLEAPNLFFRVLEN